LKLRQQVSFPIAIGFIVLAALVWVFAVKQAQTNAELTEKRNAERHQIVGEVDGLLEFRVSQGKMPRSIDELTNRGFPGHSVSLAFVGIDHDAGKVRYDVTVDGVKVPLALVRKANTPHAGNPGR
jgi:hypothetical protein